MVDKLTGVGNMEAVKVVPASPNYAGNNLTLSKKRVTPSDRERCTEVYSRGKAVNSILRHGASILDYKSNACLVFANGRRIYERVGDI